MCPRVVVGRVSKLCAEEKTALRVTRAQWRGVASRSFWIYISCVRPLAYLSKFCAVSGQLVHEPHSDVPSASLFDNFVYGAPAIVPVLFPNLALLAGIGLWILDIAPVHAVRPQHTSEPI
jgi:hypothetical protein